MAIRQSRGFCVHERPGVYFLRSGTAVKIGYSSNMKSRLASYRSSHPGTRRPITMGYIETADKESALRLEQELHRRFALDRLERRHEWFSWTETMWLYIQQHPSGVVNKHALMTNVRMYQ